MIAHQTERGNALPLASLITLTTLTSQLVDYVHQAARDGTPVHVVERGIWNQILALGHKALGLFFQEQGTGDMGEQIQLPDGSTVARLDAPHTRDYRSVFGDFALTRTCYGTREGQKIEFVPLDNRLELGCVTLGVDTAYSGVESGSFPLRFDRLPPERIPPCQPPHRRQAGRPCPSVRER